MPPHRTIKARLHHGAESLDLTLPTDIRRECGVEPGDVFAVAAECDENGDIEIRYRRVFSGSAPRRGANGRPSRDRPPA